MQRVLRRDILAKIVQNMDDNEEFDNTVRTAILMSVD